MALSSDLISQFVQVTKEEKTDKETTVYGTIVKYNGERYVKLDGSELLTPISMTADALEGERVTVMIKNHTATVTGNISSPAARNHTVIEMGETVEDVKNQIAEFAIVIADKVSVERLEAEIARIDTLVAENVTIKGRLDANEAEIDNLIAENVTITGKLEAAEASITELETKKLDAEIAEITYADIESLDAIQAHIHNLEATYGEFYDLTTERLTAAEATIDDLEVEKLDATEAELKYANIDFANIGEAAIKKIFSDSGIIKDLIVSEGTITGELVGVTIKGDLIEAGTLRADKLVVLGSDGKYYKLNTDFTGIPNVEPVDEDKIHGSAIVANSVTAEKIAVDDLVAFGATIGGFKITDNAIYSGVKNGPLNTTRGVYMDNEGQFSLGDSNNFFRYFKDSEGKYKLELSASSLKFTSSSSTVEEEINNLKNSASTYLHIESSQGTIIDESVTSTVLSVSVYHGGQRITDITTLKSIIGDEAYLEWSFKGSESDTFETIPSDDARIGNDGFTLTLSANDIGTKTIYTCELMGPTTTLSGSDSSSSGSESSSEDTSLAREAYDLASAVETRVTSAETSITQNRESITLCATKEEVEHVRSVADTAQETAVYAESLIKQLADNISMLVTDGNGTSLMTQTEDGWIFSTSELQNAVDSTSESLDTIFNSLGDTTSTIQILQQAVDDLGVLTDYIAIGSYEDQPCIELGETDSEFKLRITNTQVVYTEGSSVLAYFTNQSMHINKAVIEEELYQGGFVWKVRSNGNMGLVWKGASS